VALPLPETLPRTVEPRCPHFGECGGCALQDVSYEDQLRVKQDVISNMLGRDVPVVPSPDPFGYRHRMDYITAFGKVGLRKKGDGKTVINLTECHLVQPRVSALLADVRDWVDELGIRGYNIVTNRGDLRYMTVRHALSSDQLMVILVTSSEETAIEPLIERLAERAESVVWSVQDRKGDDARGEVQRIVGADTLIQSVGDLDFEISPNCFFQNNLLLVDRMFDEIVKHVEGYTMDLFCGTGTIGIAAAHKASKVLGVEVMEENVELAHRNAARNHVDNIDFVLDNANHFLAFYEGDVPDTVIIDPPRSGLAPKFIRKLNRLAAPRIVYVSCNPKTYMTDLEQLEGYKLVEAVGFDMFPQTPHAELVTLLERQ